MLYPTVGTKLLLSEGLQGLRQKGLSLLTMLANGTFSGPIALDTHMLITIQAISV